ncbi:MAG: putative peptidase M15 [Prokaryotic dsDNA virus sp.]|nr:MAG: putative peptidase M15 [Prokaryotic dsDNA virus sp.]|tara:strand:+ start:3018 stop:3374 length:357 start_codon:yes stop_codon:yes gene_type:complete
MMLSKNFSRQEFKCQCGSCDYDTVDAELINVLQSLREHFDKPVKITSGNRCTLHNASIGGSLHSYHIRGRAADIQVSGVSAIAVQGYLTSIYADKFGIGSYASFTHIDTRTKAGRWNG